jgi:hypothetical protein
MAIDSKKFRSRVDEVVRRAPQGIFLAAFCLLAGLLFAGPAGADGQYWVYTVRPGDTIWNLTEKHCTSVLHWKRVQRLNNLPDVPARGLLPGTRLKFPIDILKHQPVSARIRLLQGAARVVRAAGEELPVRAGLELYSGDRLRVDEDSNTTVRFADGSELLVLGGSEIIFDTLSAYGETGMVDTRIRLQGGQVDTRVKPARGGGSRYEIITPAAVAAVRGTNFRVSADTDRPVARSEVLEGAVVVSGAGEQRKVPSGFGVLARAGVPPPAPKPLLPPPDLSAQRAVLEYLPLQFEWAALDKAEAYRYQVADSPSFDSLLVNATSNATRGYHSDLPNGEYALRVRGIDREGLEGIDAVRRFTVAAHPQPPVLIGLRDDVMVRVATPEFGWSRPDGIDRYHLQVSREEAFSKLFLDESSYRGERYTPATGLAPGHYYWRVASIDDAGARGPWSDASAFEYRAVPDAPAPEAPALGERVIDFHWRDAGAGMRYQFQLDSEPGFDSPDLDRQTDVPAIAIERPVADEYFFRVRAIDATGYASPWSPTQSFTVSGSIWYLLAPFGLLLLL